MHSAATQAMCARRSASIRSTWSEGQACTQPAPSVLSTVCRACAAAFQPEHLRLPPKTPVEDPQADGGLIRGHSLHQTTRDVIGDAPFSQKTQSKWAYYVAGMFPEHVSLLKALPALKTIHLVVWRTPKSWDDVVFTDEEKGQFTQKLVDMIRSETGAKIELEILKEEEGRP
ncbi:hypothetical protein EK21DRAFT_116212 [Setomelanomma holmii]|uniref:Uncharacterized protein n=1 Tax=Setomelanomma holmii TaxID=210430 RepID=A0A9P4LI08_9PLEO|nr:hypothetical protein EK21DRAFT_116212 [Setomelanomma holmii]